jgi:hypothetical protein
MARNQNNVSEWSDISTQWLLLAHLPKGNVSFYHLTPVVRRLSFVVCRPLTIHILIFSCLYTYEFWLSLWKIVRSSVILLLPIFIWLGSLRGEDLIKSVLLAHLAKGNVSFYHHLTPVIRRLSFVVCRSLTILILIFWSNKYQFYIVLFDKTAARTHNLSHSRGAR